MVVAQNASIAIDGDGSVSGLWLKPVSARACLVLGHGAGVGMAHKSMTALADGLAEREIATLRYQFPFMERGTKRPDPPAIAPAARAGARLLRLSAPSGRQTLRDARRSPLRHCHSDAVPSGHARHVGG